MVVVSPGVDLESYIVYDAPVNDATKKLREKFKVDEKTGYPEHYNWRNMARLGQSYKPEDPYLKFDAYDPKEYYTTKLTYVLGSAFISAGLHWFFNVHLNKRPIWSRLHIFFGSWIGTSAAIFWIHERTLMRQGTKNSIIIDYTRKHPERFGEIYRPKYRECLFTYVPTR